MTWQEFDGAEDLEVGYHVLPEYQGRGLATEAATACRDFAAARGIIRLIAIIHPDNHTSQRVAEKVGLTREKTTTNTRGEPIRVYAGIL